MTILIFGPGVIAGIHASWLYEAHYDVTLPAGGHRYDAIMHDGATVSNNQP